VGSQTQGTKLRVAVIGAGVAGIATAWELTTDGHTVSVFDKTGGIAEGASFASPGWVGMAGLTGWDSVSPTWPKVGPAGLTTSASWWGRSGARRWLCAMKQHSTPPQQATLFATSLDLATLSADRLRQTLSQPGVDVERSQGVMVLMRSEADAAPYAAGLQRLKGREVKVVELDSAGAKKLEPGLSDDTVPVARWWLPEDEIINGRQWLSLLKTDAMRRGCVFQMSTSVISLHAGGRLTLQTGSQTCQERVFDAVVVCAGHQGAALLADVGLTLPLLNMNQCVLSAPIRDPHFAPLSGVFDARHRISITRTGQRIRASSATGIWPGQDAEPVFKQLYQVLNDWFPGSASLHGVQSCAQAWQTTCAFTPDSLPLVGASGLSKIWLNLGFGAKGWTHAPGAARLMANLLKGGPASEQMTGLAPSRFG